MSRPDGHVSALPPDLDARFAAALDSLVPVDEPVGIAVSGGPDSLALLLLAAKARPGKIIAATVDHAIREGSRAEAEAAARLCEGLDIPHDILTAQWPEPPVSALQERARAARYDLLTTWAKQRGLETIAIGHHADDQAETLLMRLARGSGVNGLAGMRPVAVVPGSDLRLARPLLNWPRALLAAICAEAGVQPIIDPSNDDLRFERVRVRQAMATLPMLDPMALAASAAHLAEADQGLRWATDQAWSKVATEDGDQIVLDPEGLPREILRRLIVRALSTLAQEGRGDPIRGSDLQRLMSALRDGGVATLKGVKASGGKRWTFVKAPRRKDGATND